jgi:hypothetical protein
MSSTMIETLVHDDPIPHWLGIERLWTRVYGRTDAADRATLVYEPQTGADDAVCVQIGRGGSTLKGVGEIAATHWYDDPALPALKRLRAERRDLRPVRYRPGKRCTMKLQNRRPLFLKCVADDRGALINADARLLQQAARKGLLGFGVARPAGWLRGSRIIAQHALPGAPLVDRLWRDDGAALAQRLGAANASLAASTLRPNTRFDYADQMQRTARYIGRLTKRLPASAAPLDALMQSLGTMEPGAADRPIHGAPHAHQWLDGPDGLMLVDFDRFSLGDPELDVATFVAEADFEDAPGAGAAAAAFTAGYASRWPLNEKLLHAYRIHKHIAKALRSVAAVRTDAAARALDIIRGARRLADQLR